MSDPMLSVEEATARFFPRSIDYDHAQGRRLIEWLRDCGYVLVREDEHAAARGLGGEAAVNGADLISLAAWLRRQSQQTEATDLESAARLARASEVVKEAADRQRLERTAAVRPHAANQA